jgi:hypothetical protein
LGSFIFLPAARIEQSIAKVENLPNHNGEVMTNEAASNYQFGFWTLMNVWKLRPHLFLGYKIQDDDRANFAVWALGARFNGGRFWIDGEVNGQKVVVDDGAKGNFTDELSRKAVIDIANGGSYRYYAVNPEWIEAETSIGLNISPGISVAGGLAHTISGENTAYGLSLFGKLIMDFSPDGRSTTQRKSLTDPKKQFKPQVEEYDDSLFEED